MNLGISGLWIFIIIFLIVFILLTIATQNSVNNYKNIYLLRLNGPCVPSKDAPSVDSTPKCYVNGVITSYRYVPSLDITTSLASKYWLDFCRSYCNSFDSNGNCNVPSEEESFEKCRELTFPVNCTSSSKPVAVEKSTGTPYFAFKRGNICDSI